ncbi:MAG: leucine-rich repeat domain-containing protein [Firmicutes bacterium]|nr:leucine-rich repeat domain-containing protein [Bacillota bacterium]
MRKLSRIAAALLLIGILMLAFAACFNDADNPNNGIEDNPNIDNIPNTIFTANENTVTGLTEYGATLTKLTIPNRILGYNITAIAEDAFKNNQTVTEVIIPNSITSIGNGAFAGCTSLTSITIPFVGNIRSAAQNNHPHFGWIFGATDYLGQYLFIPPSLQTVIITGGSNIENGAFHNCTGLTSIKIPDSVRQIGRHAFAYTGLTSIVIPNSVTSIGESAFAGCTGLTNVIFESGSQLTFIRDYAFWGCRGLISITIPNSVMRIWSTAFNDCTGLTDITVDPLNLNYASQDGVLFNKDKSIILKYPAGKTGVYVISNSVTSIGDNAFEGCIGLTNVLFESGSKLTTIGYRAFTNCIGLTSITIPNSATTIGEWAFMSCIGLTNIIFESGSKLTEIGERAFFACADLTSIEIPNSVTTIGFLVFGYCPNLTDIYVQGHLSPPDGWHIDWNAGTAATIHWGQ